MGGWLIAWDRYADGQYAIQHCVFDGKNGPDVSTLRSTYNSGRKRSLR